MASGDAVERVEVIETSFSLKTSRENAEIKEGESDDDDKGRSSALDKTQTDMSIGSGPTSGGAGVPRTPGAMRATDKERKIGHRRVGVGGEITYKKIQSSQIMGSIQLGIQHAVGGLASKPERDVLMNDFMSVETTNFPSEGSNHTPAHHFSEFRFKNYAPIAFRYFRDLFGIQPDDFLMSMCSAPLRELSNPGASGSIFYLTDDDEFIIKTVQHKEGEFLQKLLPGYFMNLNQNPRTLLPKFFGLYCYQCNSKNIRLVAMNNLLPSFIRLHQKYDLKGSTYKRKASKSERNKSSPTFKDLDFMEHHPEGLFLEADTYNALVRTIQRDCLVLKSFEIMDYSLLVAIHNLDQAQKDKLNRQSQLNLAADSGESAPNTPLPLTDGDAPPSLSFVQTERAVEKQDRIAANNLIRERGEGPSSSSAVNRNRPADRQRLTTMESIQAESERGEGSAPGGTTSVVLNRSRSINRQRLVAHSTAMESIQAESEPIDEEEDVPPGGIPARSAKGERLLLFIGIIDILQSYRLKKKLEHTWKSLIHDGDTVSVHRPKFYAHRFQEFMSKTVFKKIPSLDLPAIKGNHRKFRTLVTSYIALKHSPSKRKSLSRPLRQELDYESGPSTSAALQTIESKTESPTDHNHGMSSTIPAAAAPVPSVLTTPLTSPPAGSAPLYPLVLKGRPPLTMNTTSPPVTEAPVKARVPPPVPPRGSPKIKRGGSSSGSKDVGAGCFKVLNHAEGSRAGLAPSPSCSTPLPAFDDVVRQPTDSASGSMSVRSAGSSSGRSGSSGSSAAARHRVAQTVSKSSTYREETVSISDIRLESRCENKSSLSVESGSSGRGGTRGAWTPPHSVEGSTPTWTEGTPSFTESSSSGDIGCPTTPVRHVSRTGSVTGGTVSATTTHAPMPMSDCSVAAKQAAEVEHIAMCLASEMTHL